MVTVSSSVTAYALIFHGSRDPRFHQAANALTRSFQEAFGAAKRPPEWALFNRESDYSSVTGLVSMQSGAMATEVVAALYLEGDLLPLAEQIIQLAQRLLATTALNRSLELVVLPVFLLPGVHVMEDVPAALEEARRSLPPSVQFHLTPHLGSHSGLQQLLVQQQRAYKADAWVLLAHGSHRLGGNQPVEALARTIRATTAYWSMPPGLQDRIEDLAQQGKRTIGILPYFLFAGATTDAIDQLVTRLAHQFPALQLTLAAPLQASFDLGACLVDLVRLKQ
jgi:sirohydrochlorin ferrochelatase